ncbi:MAG: ribonuclease P protein component [Moraxella sp.]|nr:ribonuclease P protein component [Moraxella sp.]
MSAAQTVKIKAVKVKKALMNDKAYLFTKTQRLLTPAQYKQVFDNAIKKIHSPHLMLFVANTSDDVPHARLGLAITKKKLKNATDRNQLKRLMREHFRLNQHNLPAVDVVLIVKQKYGKDVLIVDEVMALVQKLGRYSQLKLQ